MNAGDKFVHYLCSCPEDSGMEMDMNIPKWLVIVLSALIVLSVGVSIWAIFFRHTDVGPLAPDYAPVKKEEHAENIENDDDTKMEAEEGGGAVGMIYSDQVTVDLSEKTATLFFGNPGKSLQDMVLQIVIRDEIIVQSGTIVPGKQVRTLDLLPGKEKLLAEGAYDAKFVAYYYDTETGERAMLNTEILITVTVQP